MPAVDQAQAGAPLDAAPAIVAAAESVTPAPVAPPPAAPAPESASAQPELPPAAPALPPVQHVTMPIASPQLPVAAAEHVTAAEPDSPAGIWAPNATACLLRDLRDGLLPTIIDEEGARAGDTFCSFKHRTPRETGWRVVADCHDTREHWTVVVRLTVNNRQLTWASNRGRQVYTRCAPDALKTAAR
jgi:hypothetical protein